MALAVPPGGTPPPTEYLPVTLSAPLIPRPVPRSPDPTPQRRRSAPPAPLISVAIVNFCQWRNTGRLIGQLRRSVAFRTGTANVVVVDNHSPFHPIVRKLEKLRGVTVRRFNRNLGFARGVNRGVSTGPREGRRSPAGRWSAERLGAAPEPGRDRRGRVPRRRGTFVRNSRSGADGRRGRPAAGPRRSSQASSGRSQRSCVRLPGCSCRARGGSVRTAARRPGSRWTG